MARQASEFRRVQRPIQEALIRPIFLLPGPYFRVPTIYRTGQITVNNSTNTLTVQPPSGQIWRVVRGFGLIKYIAGQDAGTSSRVEFRYNEGANATVINGISYNSGDTFSNYRYATEISGQILSNSRYLTLVSSNTSPHANIFEGSVLIEVI